MGKPKCSVKGCPHTVVSYRQIGGEQVGLCLRHVHDRETAPSAFFRHAVTAPVAAEAPREPEIVVPDPVKKMKPPPTPSQPKRSKGLPPIPDVKAVTPAERHAAMESRDALVLAWVREEVAAGRPFPTRTRIAERAEWAHPSSASRCLKRLIEAGRVRRVGGRDFVLVEEDITPTVEPEMESTPKADPPAPPVEDPRAELLYSDFVDAVTRIVCSYDVVDRHTGPLTGWCRGAGQVFAAFKAVGLEPTREQAALILEHLHANAQRNRVSYPEEGDPSPSIREAIDAVRRGEKP